MSEVLHRITSPDFAVFLMIFGVVALGCLVAVIKYVAVQWRKHLERQMATTIVVSMLERGMSASEIEGVLRAAGMEGTDARVSALPKKPGP